MDDAQQIVGSRVENETGDVWCYERVCSKACRRVSRIVAEGVADGERRGDGRNREEHSVVKRPQCRDVFGRCKGEEVVWERDVGRKLGSVWRVALVRDWLQLLEVAQRQGVCEVTRRHDMPGVERGRGQGSEQEVGDRTR